MPIYEYECAACGALTDIKHGFKEPMSESCPKCGGVLKRVFRPAGIVFKGSGFYVTDSRKSSDKSGGTKTDAGKSDGAKADDAKTGDAKTGAAQASAPLTDASKTDAPRGDAPKAEPAKGGSGGKGDAAA